MQALGFKRTEEASLKVLTSEVVKSSEIEGYTVSEVEDCTLKSKGYHLSIVFKTI